MNRRFPLWPATLLLAVLAIAGNALAIQLYYGVHFIFGSIFVLVAIRTLGARQAVMVGLAGALYTSVLWEHYYAVVVFLGECLFVLAFCQRTRRSLFLADSLFWCLLGIPTTLTLYHLGMDIPVKTAFVIAVKQMLNGIFNAAMAGLILCLYYLLKNRISTGYLVSSQIRSILFHTILMTALASGSVPVLQLAETKQQTQARELERELAESFQRVARFFAANPDYTQDEWQTLKDSMGPDTRIFLYPISASPDRLGGTSESGFRVDHVRSTNQPSVIKSWQEGTYQLSGVLETHPTTGVVISRSARSVSMEMDAASLEFLGYMAALLALAIVVSRGVSNLLTRPIWRLSTLLNSSTNGIITTDIQGRIEWINQGFVRLSGYELDEILGRKPGSFLQGPDTDPDTVERIRGHLSQQEPFEEELLNYHREGWPYWIRINCEPLLSEDGRLAGYIAVETDITEQRKIAHLENVGSEALERIAENGRLEDTLLALASSVEDFVPDIRCSIELSASLLGDHCDLNAACYFDVSGGSMAGYRYCETVSPLILDPAKNVIGRLNVFYRGGDIPSKNDCAVFKRAAHIVAIIVERYYADYRLAEAAGVFRHANEGMVVADASGVVLDCNQAFTDITGLDPGHVHGRLALDLLWEMEAVQEPGTEIHVPAPEDQRIRDTWIRHKNGKTSCVRRSVSLVRDKHGDIHRYIYILNDISELKEYQSQLESMAKFDPLTKLPNRTLLSDRLQQAMINCERNGSELAVLFIDLDGFKEINDGHGHAVGDELLRSLARRLRSIMREGDTLARFGGDEFVMVAPVESEVKSCPVLLDRILAAVAQQSRVLGKPVALTASIGVTFYPQADPLDAEQLLRQADQAMYLAKQGGKNQYCFYDADNERAVRDLFKDLKRVEEGLNNEEFELFYQPKVNLRTRQVIGVEALIRWRHPIRGLLGPADFLPVTERHPLSVGIGEWVIRTALAQVRRWRKNGLRLPVSVNIDPFHLVREDFAERLRRLLGEYPETRPGDLEIEIVETSSLENFNAVNKVIQQCRTLGVRFGLDDFGTGYSSLTYLRQLPLDYLKIDMSFVRGMLDNPDDLAIVKGVLGLADSLDLPVIAEGVETLQHRNKLMTLGCEFGQGYWLSRPVSGEDLEVWMSQWQEALPEMAAVSGNLVGPV